MYSTQPTMPAGEMGPKWRLSDERARLAPGTKQQHLGTVSGSKVGRLIPRLAAQENRVGDRSVCLVVANPGNLPLFDSSRRLRAPSSWQGHPLVCNRVAVPGRRGLYWVIMQVHPRPVGIVAPVGLRRGVVSALPWVLAVLCGCQGLKTIVDPLNVLGGFRPPVRVGVTTLDLAPPLLMLPKRELFNLAMADYLKEQVQFELLTPRQIRVHLSTGRMAFAMLRPIDYAQLAPTDACQVLAMPLNSNGQPHRQGLIITAPKSAIKELREARSARVHFMPDGNPLNDALQGALVEAGIPKDQIDKGILGLGLDTHHISSLEVAKSVVLEEKAVGVIDEADYDKWPKSGGSFVLLAPSQDQVRIIGKTARVPEGYFVVSAKAPPELKSKMEEFLFTAAPKHHKLALASMDITGYTRPSDQQEYESYCRLIRRLHQPTSPPAPTRETPASLPAKAGS